MKVNGVYVDDNGTPIDRFHLEAKIMEAWHLVQDIKLLYYKLEYMNEDQISSAMLGLEIFADMRFDSLFDTFEQCAANGVFNDNNRHTVRHRQDMAETTEGFGQEKI